MNKAKVIMLTCCLLGMAILIASCSQIRVRSDYDSEVDFSKYSSFKIVKHKKVGPKHNLNPLVDKKIRRSLTAEMITKGYDNKEFGEPDLLVAFHASARNKVQITEEYYPYRWRRPPAKRVTVNSYKEGTLVVDMIDAASREIIWRGWATGVIHGPNQADEQIRKSVVKLLEQFPPQP